MAAKLTLKDIEEMDCDFLTPAVVGEALGCNPHSIRIAARTHPEYLCFPVIVLGSRTKIPRKAFLNAINGGGKAFIGQEAIT